MKAGYAKRDITPDGSMEMAGFDRRTQPANGTLDRIELIVLALTDAQNETVVFLTFDLLGTRSAFVEAVRQQLQTSYSIPPEHVFVGATHTHSAPHLPYPTDDPTCAAYAKRLLAISVEAVGEALERQEPVTPYLADTQATGVASLRNRGREGSAFPMPMQLTLLQGKQSTYLLSRISCHPTVLDEKNLLYSRDLPGQMRDNLSPAFCTLVQNSACADLSTRFTRTASDAAELSRLGLLLSDAAKAAKPVPCPALGERIRVAERIAVLPCAAELDPETRQSLLAALREKAAACTDTQALREYDSRIVVLERAAGKKEKTRKIHVGAVDLGPYLLLTLPFEVDYIDGITLESDLAKLAGKPVRLVCYTGGYDGYLPSGLPLTADSSYEDIASPYLPQARTIVWESAAECVNELTQIG